MQINETAKKLLFSSEARAELLKGVEQLTQAVAVTMGPGGHNVVIEQPGNLIPILTKDGVTVAKAVNLPDRMQNIGVQLVKEAAQGAAEIAGDGTTTSTVLAHGLFANGLKSINAGHNPVMVRKGMIDAAEQTISKLSSMAKPIESDEEIIQVGTISANGEKEIAEYLCKAMNAVGRDGVITVEEAKGFRTTLSTVEGTRLNRGYISPYFINDEARGCVKYSKPYVLLANRKFSTIKELLPILEKVHQAGKPLLIIADDVDGEALNAIVLNNVKSLLKCCVIRAPEFGSGRVSTMEDLAFLLGTKVITAADESLSQLELFELGKVDKLVVTKSETLLVGTPTKKQEVQNYCNKINAALEEPGLSHEEKTILSRRLVRLSGGVAILKVGGSTEAELRERKDRVEDALYATRAAVKSGILEGGGTALLRASRSIKTNEKNVDYIAGWNLFKEVCSLPLRQIVKNAGQVPELILERTIESKSNLGYDARNDKFVNLIKEGIIDPALVVISAVRHASSAANNLLSISCAMHEVESNLPEANFKDLHK